MALIQPLKPYSPFTDQEGRLTKDGYAFLFNMYLRVGGSLSSLNAVTLADATWDAPNPIGTTTPNSGKFTTLSVSGQLTSTLAIGTPPLVVTSTTNIPNLNASSLNGATFAAPGTIGSTTPAAGTFTTLTANGAVSLSPANLNVTASPTGTGTVTISPNTAGTLNNITIGGVTPKPGTFTTLTGTGAISLSPANLNVVLSPTGTGVVTINPATLGTLDKVTIGGTTPAAGTFTTVNGNIISTGTGTLTLAASKILTVNNSITFAGTDSTTMTFPSTSATIARTDAANTFTGNQTITGAFGCNTKAAQTAYASGGALNAYGAGANGFDTGANASALYAMVVAIRAALVANGIMS